MNALVLAAGKSTRIQSVTGGHPKPLLKISGESIIGRNLRWLAEEDITKIWVNLHFCPQEIQQAIGDGSQFGVEVQFVYEPEILGTAGALKNIASGWGEPCLVVYGDSLVRFDLGAMVQGHQQHRPLATVALFDQETHHHTAIAGGQVRVDRDCRILDFAEQSGTYAPCLVNAGVYVVEPLLVEEIPPSTFYDFGRDLFPRLLGEDKQLMGHMIDGYCLGMDTPESYKEALRLIENGEVALA